MTKIDIIFLIFFMHFLSDFYLQSHSNSMIKDKTWWQKHKGGKYNHIFGLIIHSFVWSYATYAIPCYIYQWSNFHTLYMVIPLLFIDTIIHAMIDHLKTNLKKISALQDQLCHCAQCLYIWISIVCIEY